MIGTLLAGRFEIISTLGQGGFGETYLAHDLHLPGHPKCVVKRLKPMDSRPIVLETARKLFDREAQTLYKLGKHPQIPELLGHFEHNHEFYLAQEYVAGTVLSDIIQTGSPQPEQFVEWLLAEVLPILAFVHNNGVIHRDIKPSNLIKRQTDDKIVLIDFGAVKEVSMTTLDTQGHTSTTVAIGSLGYMPDEQANGKPKFASDIFALGVTCIHALTGIPPHKLPEDVRTGQIIWRNLCPTVNPALADLLDKMIRPHFSQRFARVEEVLTALANLHLREAPTITIATPTTTVTALHTPPQVSEIDKHNPTIYFGNGQTAESEMGRAMATEIKATVPVNPPVPTVYRSEQENLPATVQALPKGRSPLPLVLFVLLGGAGYGGWHYWQNYRLEQRIAQASESLSLLFTVGKFQECLDRANQYESGVREHDSIRSVVSRCHQELGETNAQNQLAEAKRLAQAKKFKEAIDLATKINPATKAYPASQQLANTWAEEIIKTATRQYQQEGKFQEATTALRTIPTSLPNGKRANDLLSKWDKEWQNNEKLKKDADKAVQEGKWNDVLTLEQKVTTPYWKKQFAPLVQRANLALTPVYTPPPPPAEEPSYSAPSYSPPAYDPPPPADFDLPNKGN